MTRLYCVHITEGDIARVPKERVALSPLAWKLRIVFGSQARLVGPRLWVGDRPTALCLDKAAEQWQERWLAGLSVRPALCWIESRPACPRPDLNPHAVRRAEG